MDKRFWSIIGILVVIFGGIIILKGHKANAPSGGTQPSNHVTGAGKKGVTLVEYGDYECPVCDRYYQPVKDTVAKYGDDITFQFRNLPLSQIHQNAFAGARAAEAASLQNKFWQMHDALYENQSAWSQAKNPQTYFDQYARQLGLNVSQFDKDFASTKVNNVINADLSAFAKTGRPEATPTFFLNGKVIQPDATVEAISHFIDQAIAAKK